MANSVDPDQTAPLDKQCRPWSDCSSMSGLIWVYTVCSGLSIRKLKNITLHLVPALNLVFGRRSASYEPGPTFCRVLPVVCTRSRGALSYIMLNFYSFFFFCLCLTALSEIIKQKKKEPEHDKTNKITCVCSKDSDQPGHLPSPISVFTVCIKKS